MPWEHDDLEVIHRVRAGNVNAYAHLVNRHKARVAAIATRHVPPDRVQEVAQDAFVRAFQSLDGFRGDQPFSHWLAAITVRACHDFWRSHYRNRETSVGYTGDCGPEGFDALTTADAVERFETDTGQREASALLEWAMGQLSADDRIVLALTHLEGYTTAEAAAMLGWTTVNVKVRAFRSREKLRRILAAAGEEKEGRT
ncbi:MAG: RNA polymerase sigma factor [Desulfovibrionaceae bacterium]